MITLPKNFKKVLLTGTALVAVSFVGAGQAQAQQRVIDSALPNLVNTAIDGKWLTTDTDGKFINLNIDNHDVTLGAVASSAVTITNNNQTIYIFDGNADTTVNKLTLTGPALGHAVDNSAAANTLNIVLGAEGNTTTGVGTQAPANSQNVHVVFGGSIVTHADGKTNIGLDPIHGKSGNIIEFGAGVNLGKGTLSLSSGFGGGTMDTARFTGNAAQTFTGDIAGAGIIDVATTKTVTFNGSVIANQMKLTGVGATIDGNAVLNLNTFTSAADATVSNKIMLSGVNAGTSVDAGKTLTLTGAGSLLGKATVGAGGTLYLNHAAGDANKVMVGAVDAASGTVKIGAGTADLSGSAINVGTLVFADNGVVNLNGATTITNAVDTKGRINVAGGSLTVTGGIDNTGSVLGLTNAAAVTVDGNLTNVGEIVVAGAGGTTINSAVVNTGKITFSEAGAVTFANATGTGATATEIDFSNKAGSVTFGAADVNFNGNAKSTGGANGTMTFAGTGAKASGTFGGGAAGTALSVLNVGSGADAASLNLSSANAQYINTINVNNATLTTNGDLNGTTHLTHANSKLIVNDGKNLTNAGGAAITTAANGVGTVEFVGDSTVTGTVGAADFAVGTIDVQGDSKHVQFGGAVTANALNITHANGAQVTLGADSAIGTVALGAGTLNLNAALTGNVNTGTTGKVIVANTKTLTGNVTGAGVLEFAGEGFVTGSVGTDAATRVGKVDIKGATGSTALITGASFIDTLAFSNDGAASFSAHSNINTLTFTAAGIASFQDGATINNAITTDGTIWLNGGTFTATGGVQNGKIVTTSLNAVTVNGAIGTAASKLVHVSNHTGTTTYTNADFHVADLFFTGAGTVDIKAATTVGAQTINFKGHNGTVQFGDNVTYTGTASNLTDGLGVLEFGNNANIGTAATIGAVGNKINDIRFAGTATVDADVHSNQLTVGAGAVTLNGTDYNMGNVRFGGDGVLNLKTLNKITGDVTTATAGTGAITFKDGLEITGNVDRLREMKLVGNAKIGGNAQAANTTEILTHTLEVGGTYTAGAGTQLVYQVNTPTTSGQIKAGGAVTVDAGAKVNMIVDTGVYVAQGHKFVLIDGNGGNGVQALAAGNLTTTSTALLHFRQDTTNTEDLVVYADRTMMGSIAGSTPNTAAVGVVLDGVADKGGADVTALQIRLANMLDASQVTQTLETLLPDVGAGAATSVANVGTTTSTIASNRLSHVRGNSGVSSGNEAMWGNAHVWMQGFGGKAEQDNREGIAGYDAETWGGVVGADVSVTDALRAGLAFAYANTEVDSNSRNIGKTDIDSYQFMLYGDYDLGSNTFLAGQLGYMRSNVDTKRYNVGGLANNTARGEYDIDQYSARAELGRDIVRDSMTLTPSLFANYSHMDFGSYSETGVGGLGLRNVSADDMAVFEVGLNVSNEWTFDDGMGGFVKPGLHGGFRYDFINDAVGTTARLAGGGAAFKTNGVKSEPHTFNLGASLGWELQSNVELKANYDYETKDDYEAHSGYVRVGVRF